MKLHSAIGVIRGPMQQYTMELDWLWKVMECMILRL